MLKYELSKKADEYVKPAPLNILSTKYLTFIKGLKPSSNLFNDGLFAVAPSLTCPDVAFLLILPAQFKKGYFKTEVVVAPDAPAKLSACKAFNKGKAPV